MSKTQEMLERLLLNILPLPIAMRLTQGEKAITDSFSDVSVLFADLVGFATLADHLPPTELVKLLHQIFCIFDQLAQEHGVEKIKTIGDTYMVAGGVPNPRSDHAEAVVEIGNGYATGNHSLPTG